MVTETPGKERVHNQGIPVPSAAPSTKHSVPSVPCLQVCSSVGPYVAVKVAARERANCLGTLQVSVKVGWTLGWGWRWGWWRREGCDPCPPVRVALSRPLLSPHPLPFRCRERGVAAFAGEMADDGAGWGRALGKSEGVRNIFNSEAENSEKQILEAVFSADLSTTLSLHCRLSFHLSFCQTLFISHRGRSSDNRRQGKKKEFT